MRVVYAQAARLAGPGIGTTAYHHVRQLESAGCLEQIISGRSDSLGSLRSRLSTIPGTRVMARLARDRAALRDAYFDRMAAFRLEPCDVFHGWSHQSLHCLRRARRLGAVTVVEQPSTHDRHRSRILAEEFDRWGWKGRPPVHPVGLRRGLAEEREADLFFVPSRFAYETMTAEGVDPRRLFLTHYGADLQRFRPAEPASGPFRLLFVGHLSLRKGIPYLLAAWRRLRLPAAELWLAGRLTADARRVVEPFRRDPTICFLGHVRDIAPVYRQASAVVLPSLEEGSALVTYEAMACSLPLVFTPNSGAVARHDVEGLEVPIRDEAALAESILLLYRDPDRRVELGRAGRRRSERFSWEAAGRRLLEGYEQALAGGAG